MTTCRSLPIRSHAARQRRRWQVFEVAAAARPPPPAAGVRPYSGCSRRLPSSSRRRHCHPSSEGSPVPSSTPPRDGPIRGSGASRPVAAVRGRSATSNGQRPGRRLAGQQFFLRYVTRFTIYANISVCGTIWGDTNVAFGPAGLQLYDLNLNILNIINSNNYYISYGLGTYFVYSRIFPVTFTFTLLYIA